MATIVRSNPFTKVCRAHVRLTNAECLALDTPVKVFSPPAGHFAVLLSAVAILHPGTVSFVIGNATAHICVAQLTTNVPGNLGIFIQGTKFWDQSVVTCANGGLFNAPDVANPVPSDQDVFVYCAPTKVPSVGNGYIDLIVHYLLEPVNAEGGF